MHTLEEQPSQIGRDFIDIEKVIASKSESLARRLPKFVIRYLKRIIHQDELNEGLYRYRELQGVAFADAVLKGLFQVKIVSQGLENIPSDRRFIVAANHPLGGLDGLALMKEVGAAGFPIVFPVNDLLMVLPNLRDLFVPINKHGSNAGNIAILEQTFASERAMLYFPAGLCSRKQGSQIVDLEWKKTFVSKARQYQRDIVPVYIEGSNSSFFYNLARLRKFLGIKVNLEMLYLVDEMFNQKDRQIKIVFGKPVAWQMLDRSRSDKEWARKIKKHVYGLASEAESVFV